MVVSNIFKDYSPSEFPLYSSNSNQILFSPPTQVGEKKESPHERKKAMRLSVMAMDDKIKNCGQETIPYLCGDCGKSFATDVFCHNRYCKNCYDARLDRAFAKIVSVSDELPMVLDHIVLTDVYQKYSKRNRRKLGNSFRKFNQMLKRKKFQRVYVGVYDLGSPNCDGEHHLHIHLMVAHSQNFYIPFGFFQKAWSRATGRKDAVIKIFRKRNKIGLVSYFAMRSAGNFGHAENPIMFSDVMSLEYYHSEVHGSRFFMAFIPKGLCSISVRSNHKLCPFCGSDNVFYAGCWDGQGFVSNISSIPT